MYIIGRITGASRTQGGIYEYDFQQILFNPQTGNTSNGNYKGKAYAIGEIGKQVSAPTIKTGTYAALIYTGMIFYIISAGNVLIDVSYSYEDDEFIKEYSDGTREVWAESTLHE